MGADLLIGPPWSVTVTVDGRLVTGQNPQSSTECARRFVDLLQGGTGRALQTQTPQSPEPFKDKAGTGKQVPSLAYAQGAAHTADELQALVSDYLQFYRNLQCQEWQEGAPVDVEQVGKVAYSELMSTVEPYTKAQVNMACDAHTLAQYLIFGTNETEWDDTCLGVEILKEFSMPHTPGARTVQYREMRIYRNLMGVMSRRDAVVMSFMMWLHDNSFLMLARSVADPAVPPSPNFVRMEVLWHSKHITPTANGCSVEVIIQENVGSALSTFASAPYRRAIHKQAKIWHGVVVQPYLKAQAKAASAKAEKASGPAVNTPPPKPVPLKKREEIRIVPATLNDEIEAALKVGQQAGVSHFDNEVRLLSVDYKEAGIDERNHIEARLQLTIGQEWGGSVVLNPVPVVKWGLNFGASFVVFLPTGHIKTIYLPGIGSYDPAGLVGDVHAPPSLPASSTRTIITLTSLMVYAVTLGATEKQIDEIYTAFGPIIDCFHARGTLARWMKHQVIAVMLYEQDCTSYPEFVETEGASGLVDLNLPARGHTVEYLASFRNGDPIPPQEFFVADL
eukprot:c18530_g1_i6.p1 GENE.c18530_g1_i6~~c18530_g1_i6.p1  ORF type:complete len:563 (+),score=127.61 c18530_g1_i6:117-1805(+)